MNHPNNGTDKNNNVLSKHSTTSSHPSNIPVCTSPNSYSRYSRKHSTQKSPSASLNSDDSECSTAEDLMRHNRPKYTYVIGGDHTSYARNPNRSPKCPASSTLGAVPAVADGKPLSNFHATRYKDARGKVAVRTIFDGKGLYNRGTRGVPYNATPVNKLSDNKAIKSKNICEGKCPPSGITSIANSDVTPSICTTTPPGDNVTKIHEIHNAFPKKSFVDLSQIAGPSLPTLLSQPSLPAVESICRVSQESVQLQSVPGAAHRIVTRQQNSSKQIDISAISTFKGSEDPDYQIPGARKVKKTLKPDENDQLEQLTLMFLQNPYPKSKEYEIISEKVGISTISVKVWFQKQRVKYRRNNSWATITDAAEKRKGHPLKVRPDKVSTTSIVQMQTSSTVTVSSTPARDMTSTPSNSIEKMISSPKSILRTSVRSKVTKKIKSKIYKCDETPPVKKIRPTIKRNKHKLNETRPVVCKSPDIVNIHSPIGIISNTNSVEFQPHLNIQYPTESDSLISNSSPSSWVERPTRSIQIPNLPPIQNHESLDLVIPGSITDPAHPFFAIQYCDLINVDLANVGNSAVVNDTNPIERDSRDQLTARKTASQPPQLSPSLVRIKNSSLARKSEAEDKHIGELLLVQSEYLLSRMQVHEAVTILLKQMMTIISQIDPSQILRVKLLLDYQLDVLMQRLNEPPTELYNTPGDQNTISQQENMPLAKLKVTLRNKEMQPKSSSSRSIEKRLNVSPAMHPVSKRTKRTSILKTCKIPFIESSPYSVRFKTPKLQNASSYGQSKAPFDVLVDETARLNKEPQSVRSIDQSLSSCCRLDTSHGEEPPVLLATVNYATNEPTPDLESSRMPLRDDVRVRSDINSGIPRTDGQSNPLYLDAKANQGIHAQRVGNPTSGAHVHYVQLPPQIQALDMRTGRCRGPSMAPIRFLNPAPQFSMPNPDLHRLTASVGDLPTNTPRGDTVHPLGPPLVPMRMLVNAPEFARNPQYTSAYYAQLKELQRHHYDAI